MAQKKTVGETEFPAQDEVRTENLPSVAAQKTGTALDVVDLGEDEGVGLEDVGMDEQRIPFFRILQTNSPQVNPGEAAYIPEAKAGMIMNTATGQLYEEFDFVPVYRDHNYVEYTPRDQGGGFVGIWPVDDPRLAKLKAEQSRFGRLTTPDGTELTETFYLYSLIEASDGVIVRGMLGFASTQIKKYQGLLSRLNTITYPGPDGKPRKPALYSHRAHAGKPVLEKNKKGTFFGWKLGLKQEPPIRSLIPQSDPLLVLAREFHALIKAGTVQAAYEAAGADDDKKDEEIPY